MKYSLRQGYDKSMAFLVLHTQAGLQAYAVLGKLCHDDNLDLGYTIEPWPFQQFEKLISTNRIFLNIHYYPSQYFWIGKK